MKVFAIPGESAQVVTDERGATCPEGHVEMQSDRPGVYYVAGSDGQWISDEIAEHKSTRAEKVASIVVEVDGLKFDGDEISQGRMGRAIIAASGDGDSVNWILADNTVATVTAAQLKQALRLAGEEMARLWIPGQR
ncbi:DUF4376 domain-containing protein [Kistimonas asteriae]|uniref:DUF4376 domain-containing protein n=1 Tax=Kistimonas asteriae TaxID=517724 RepID=UPI001BABB8B0|nr:DUF4376 domain-containing protein [Kistimonas asteriae]